ncbi:PIN domain-containing protein [Candidatus Roizmanbacteria bacterium]|nr:PIN domain-containing protein [Candidatus Roizmanbacteria bacterium]
MAEKIEQIFIDSNFLIAIYNPNDGLHKKASKMVSGLEKFHAPFYISNYVFSEVVTILSQKVGRREAIIAGDNALNSGNFSFTFIDESLQTSSWKIFQEIKKKNMSFVDCSSLAIMRYMGIRKFLTFDTADFASLRKNYSFSFVAI